MHARMVLIRYKHTHTNTHTHTHTHTHHPRVVLVPPHGSDNAIDATYLSNLHPVVDVSANTCALRDEYVARTDTLSPPQRETHTHIERERENFDA